MTPLSIEIEGIRSFTTSRTIDFSGLELFAIVGDTGSGKSSILEAMIYALFNATSWDGKNVKELMSASATRMRVCFRFTLGERTFTVTRITPRIGAAVHIVECPGFPDERRDGERAVNARLAELLGVDRDQFIKTVILPQGEFAALLTLKPGDRARLLTDVLGLGVIDEIAEKVSIVRQRARSLYDNLEGRRTTLPKNPEASLRDATTTAERRASDERTLQVALDEISANKAALVLLGHRSDRRAGVATAFATITSEVRGLGLLRATDEALRQQVMRAESERAEANHGLKAATAQFNQAKVDGVDAESIAGAQKALVRLSAQWTELSREQFELERRKTEAASAEATLATEAAAHEASRAKAEASAILADAARFKAQVASTALQAAEKALDALSRARTAAGDAKKQQTIALALLVENTTEAARTKQLDDEAEATLTVSRARLSQAERENAAAHAAHGLTAGDACPICLRALPRGFKPPAAADLDEAKRQAKEAEARRRDLARAHTQAEAQVAFAQKAALEADEKIRSCQTELDAAMADAKDTGVDVVAETSKALGGVREAAALAEAERSAAAEALSAAQSEASRAQMLRDATAGRVLDIKKDVARREDGIATRVSDVGALRREIPDRYLSTMAELSGRLLAAAEAQLGVAAETAGKVSNAYVAALQAEREAAERLHALVERRRLEIDQPISGARARLLAASEIALTSGYAMPAEPVAESEWPLARALEWGDRLLAASANAEAALAKENAEDAAAVSRSNAEIAKLLERFEVANATELEAKREAALLALGAATKERDGLALAVVEAAKLDAELAKVEPAARALDALYVFLSGTKFKKFVTDRKQERLLGVATAILGRMTNDRYGFGPEMSIVDKSASQARKAETLSGGEKFLASLALALALVEIAKRSGRHFGALFLDEGFGSLDPQALDEALSELERQSLSGRMIGVITHIRAVVEYIDDVLRVVRTPNGSEVLRDSGDDELEPEVSAA